MARVLVLLVAVLFAAGVALPAPASAQAPAKSEKSGATKADAKPAGKKGAPLDINTATPADLQTLPGVGEAYSKKIVEHRPYKRKDELVQKKIVPQATYDQIKDMIVAKQAPAKK
jgi:DNA uptake protein ComE-like DNA-binding protein